MADSIPIKRGIPKPELVAGGMALVLVTSWAYWEPMAQLASRWWHDPDYQYGFLVPVYAGILLWLRRAMMPPTPWKGTLWAIGFFCLAATMKWASAYLFITLLEPLSLIPCLAGIALLLGGWRAWHWAWPSIVFLTFMVPLPGVLGDLLGHPLQRIGTVASTYLIHTVGIPAVAQGNVILLPESEIGVVEACNGLRMLMLFVTVCVGAAFMVQRTWPEKVIVILSAIPIAVLANIARITTTAILYQIANAKLAQTVFHDLAGWFMMPLAIVMLWLEMAILSKLLVDSEDVGPMALEMAGAGGSAPVRSVGKAPRSGTAKPAGGHTSGAECSKRRATGELSSGARRSPKRR